MSNQRPDEENELYRISSERELSGFKKNSQLMRDGKAGIVQVRNYSVTGSF